jgi:hypothetical protein
MSDEKKVWYYECPRCDNRYIAYFKGFNGECWRHNLVQTMNVEYLPSREATKRLNGNKKKRSAKGKSEKNKKKASKKSGSQQMSLGL